MITTIEQKIIIMNLGDVNNLVMSSFNIHGNLKDDEFSADTNIYKLNFHLI